MTNMEREGTFELGSELHSTMLKEPRELLLLLYSTRYMFLNGS